MEGSWQRLGCLGGELWVSEGVLREFCGTWARSLEVFWEFWRSLSMVCRGSQGFWGPVGGLRGIWGL